MLFAQKSPAADKLFQEGKYKQAREKYAALLKSSPNNTYAIFHYARCSQELGDLKTALEYYRKLPVNYKDKYCPMGNVYVQQLNPDAAIEAYMKYLSLIGKDIDEDKQVAELIVRAEKVQRYLRRVERIVILDSILVPIDKMLDQLVLSTEAGQLKYDLLTGLQYTNPRGDYRLSAIKDGASQKLYSAHRLIDSWTEPEELPDNINFAKKHSSPYLLSDGVTLYFAAESLEGFGGLDIYVSRFNVTTQVYTDPDNIGLPYNSSSNEYMLILDEAQQKGYLATDRFAPAGYVHIYTYRIPQKKQYWRDVEASELSKYAQLRAWDVNGDKDVEIDDNPLESSVVDSLIMIVDATSDDFRFVLNDSVVYTIAEQFKSDEAYLMFETWEKTDKQIRGDELKLEDLRKQYLQADEQRREELTSIIIDLESKLYSDKKRNYNLLLEIRHKEMSAH
jgi:tetratricopeptide (TPR) repeat protein